MKREYIQKNVYEAVQERFDFLFREFENIYVSFSGGKDSGLLLNLLLDFKRTYYPQRTVGVFHQDFEAQYTVTTEYVTKTFERLESEVDPYWVCLPMATRTALSSYEMFWYPWDDRHPELWVRPMPSYSYVINMDKPFDHYRYRMHQEDLAKQFGRFYKERHGGGRTVCLLGLRADESLQRYSGFVNKKHGYKGECWICDKTQTVSIPKLKPFVKLNKKTISLTAGKSYRLKASYAKGDSVKKCKSSNKKVATVSKKGVISARQAGKVRITIYTKSGKKATCKVTVTAKKKATKKSSSNKRGSGSGSSKTNGSTVYWTPGGAVYHRTPNCPTLSRSRTIYHGSISSCPKNRGCKVCF